MVVVACCGGLAGSWVLFLPFGSSALVEPGLQTEKHFPIRVAGWVAPGQTAWVPVVSTWGVWVDPAGHAGEPSLK